jgi:hypothetical protein
MENLANAIIEVMKEIKNIEKNMTVWIWMGSYKWVADKDVKETIRESMIKNWLLLIPIWGIPKIQIDRWEEIDKNWVIKNKQSVFTEIQTEYMLLHTSWESTKVYWYWQWVDVQDKWAGKATTYALKNTLLNMFLVPTWVDTDDTHSNKYDIVPKNKKLKELKRKLINVWYNTKEKAEEYLKTLGHNIDLTEISEEKATELLLLI